jgi:hypothetical protein
MLVAACVWEDGVYNLTRAVKTLRVEVKIAERHWQPRSSAMAVGITDPIWSIRELLMAISIPINCI